MELTLLYLPVFLIQLSWLNIVFLIKAVWAKYAPFISAGVSLCLLALYLSLWWLHYNSSNQQFTQPLKLFQAQQHQELETMKTEWLLKLKQQPTHRDLLYNVAQISCQLGDNDCEVYLQQARQSDPNNSLFN